MYNKHSLPLVLEARKSKFKDTSKFGIQWDCFSNVSNVEDTREPSVVSLFFFNLTFKFYIRV